MLFMLIATMIYYKIKYDHYDIYIVITLIFVQSMLTFSTYQLESKDKMMFLQMKNIQMMNDELKSILMEMPEGVVLIDEQTEQVSLGNNEFKKIFRLE